jgi:penicillin amidase
MARSLAPIMAKALLAYDDTKQMGEILSKWDFKDDPNKVAPTIFHAVYRNFGRLVFVDELDPKLTDTMLKTWYYWQERLQKMVMAGSSPWFDNVQTKDKKETMQELFHIAALNARKMLSKDFGSDITEWQWGNAHKIQFVNPIRRKGFAKDLLGSGPHPMGGSVDTLYRGLYDFSKPFDVTISASMRMVVDFADNDKIMAVLAGGVCGRTFSDHQKDQVEPFMKGDKVYWWFSDKQINEHTRKTLKLEPK